MAAFEEERSGKAVARAVLSAAVVGANVKLYKPPPTGVTPVTCRATTPVNSEKDEPRPIAVFEGYVLFWIELSEKEASSTSPGLIIVLVLLGSLG